MKKFVLSLGLLASVPTLGQEIQSRKTPERVNPLRPASTLTQHAAYAGYVAIGIGYEWQGRWGLDALYGHTPAAQGGHTIESYLVKGKAKLFTVGRRSRWTLAPYMGIAAIYSPDSELFVRLPNQYSPWYYPPTALRPMLIGGVELMIKKRLGLAWEFAILDSELAYWRDSGRLDPQKMGSAGVSLRWILET